jgi:hypothetical protein
MNHFDDEEELEPEVVKVKNIHLIDFTGQVFNCWTIGTVIDQSKSIYNVICSCGKGYVRRVNDIVNNRIYRCYFCHRKSKSFVNR